MQAADTPLTINQNSEPTTARLLESAVLSGKRRTHDAPPPEVQLKKKFLGLENGMAIYLGIAIAAMIIIPLAQVAVRAKIAELLGLVKPKAEVQVVQPVPVVPPPIQPIKIPLPPIAPDTFKVTGVSLGGHRIAVINGKEHAEGDPIEIPNQSGWKVAQIRDGSVVLDYYGNFVSVDLRLLDNPRQLNDQLRPLE